eukprot:Phypoly_transcript_16775.p1 GENE.Phypoly_transcript_16775~~Phypoly_transcript_16775.p1  ORF type:complete len:256 (+),score=37.38 Phypoly_transcript_16775:3-770(+)
MALLQALVISCLVISSLALARQGAKEVENGTEFFRDGDILTIKEPSGKITVERFQENAQHSKRDQGWMASAWTYSNYTYFSTVWKVPPTPDVSTNNVVFFFNSFENNNYNDILQPVLGLNDGVNGWTLASWYGANNQYYHSTQVPVKAGDTITGVIQLKGSTWDILGYLNNVLTTQITVGFSTVSAQGNAEFAMEVYNIAQCRQYPPSNRLDAANIVLKSGEASEIPKFKTSVNPSTCNAGASFSDTSVTITWSS